MVDSESARLCTDIIMEEHNIASEMSKDIKERLQAWEAEEAAAEAAQGPRSEHSEEQQAAKGAGMGEVGVNGTSGAITGGRPPVIATPDKAAAR